MGVRRTVALSMFLPIAFLAQTRFSVISDPRVRAEAVRDARKALSGRTDAAAMAQWQDILAEMNLAHDPELKGVVRSLRSLNLYDNEAWINVVNAGYVYIGHDASAREFRAELARRRPDSKWAVEAAVEQWESAHRPRTTTEDGFLEWSTDRLKFLKALHEAKPNSDAATLKYLQAALPLESRPPAEDALAVADLALEKRKLVPYDVRFDVVRIYLHHHTRVDEVPELLDESLLELQTQFRSVLGTKDAEYANERLIAAQFSAHLALSEYWMEKGDPEQARRVALQAGVDLARLKPEAESPPDRRAVFENGRRLWSQLAGRVGIDLGRDIGSSAVDWSKVGRVPLGGFSATDLNGRSWRIQSWKGKVVLVNMWATWCAPCRAELPYLQKLHEALRGRPDRLVISINVDSDVTLARRLVQERGYTFPVIVSRQLADHIDFANGVPQNRIVDTKGRLLIQPVEGTGDAWVRSVQVVMDEVK